MALLYGQLVIGKLQPCGVFLVRFLIVFWILIVVEIFVLAALSLRLGDSNVKTIRLGSPLYLFSSNNVFS